MKSPCIADFFMEIPWHRYFHEISIKAPWNHHEITMWPFADPFPMGLPWFFHGHSLGRCPRRRWASSRAVRETSCAASRWWDGMGTDGMGFFVDFSWYFDGDFRMHMRCFMDFWWGVLGCTWGCLMIFLMKKDVDVLLGFHLWDFGWDLMVKHLDF